jgi:hypothetical protein
MYFIIGGDGKEYGPITDADIHKWIAEGRLNQQSLAKAESDAEFRALSTFPEFATAFVTAAPPPGIVGAVSDNHEAVSQKVKVPAIGLIVSASISLVMSIWGLGELLFSSMNIQQMDAQMAQLNNPQLQQFVDKILHFFYGPFGIANQIFQLIIAALILTGAIKMLKMRSYEFAFAAAILSVIPCITPCCGWVLALIFGIWAMVVLVKPDVKSRFH